MNNETIKITCPKCGEEIEISDIEKRLRINRWGKRIEENDYRKHELETEIQTLMTFESYLKEQIKEIEISSKNDSNNEEKKVILSKLESQLIMYQERKTKIQCELDKINQERDSFEKLKNEVKEKRKEN